MMKKGIYFLFFLHGLVFGAVNFSDFDLYQETLTRSQVEERLNFFLIKDPKIQGYFSLTDDTFTLYSTLDTPTALQYQLKLAQKNHTPAFKQKKTSTTLVGKKIALDPGHLGGAYARLEDRYIDIPPSLERDSSIQFDEGTLSFLTAAYLKLLLEKEGAIVLITRDEIGKSVYKEDFFDWLRKNPSLWGAETSLAKLFRTYYNPLDLRARAEKINSFQPDLSVILHYNSQDTDEKKPSNHFVVAKNYNMAFTPGAFCKNELSNEENRYEFLRLLLTNDALESIALSKAIVEEFTTTLNVPLITKTDGANYLETVCLKIDEGIYARNLVLTRLIHAPVCYGETLLQNNVDECLNLSRKDFFIRGLPCSSRIVEVAEAYFEGIKKHVCK